MHFFQSSLSGSFYGKTVPTANIRYVSDKKYIADEGADVLKLYPSASGWKSLYDKTLASEKEIYLVEIELADEKEKWWSKSLDKDSYVIFVGDSLKFENLKLIPSSDIKEFQEKKQETKELTYTTYKPETNLVSDLDCYVTGNDVNVRTEPSPSSKVIAKLNKGDALKVVGSNAIPSTDYAKIMWKSKSGNRSGYISTKFISQTKPKLTKSESYVAKTAPSKEKVKLQDFSVSSQTEETGVSPIILVGGSIIAGIGLFFLLKKKNLI